MYYLHLYVNKMQEKNIALGNQISEYQKKETKLNNMQKTVEVIYNLTPYEAHYYSIIFYDFSERYKIPWEIYPALIKIESSFNSVVLSKEHAKGMTQVLESTGRLQAEKLGIPFNGNTLWNCVLNMVIGFDFFSEGYAEYIDSTTQEKALKHAMKRYCGGPGYSQISSTKAKIYVKGYKDSLWEEYQKVSYVYKGLCYDQLTTRKIPETINLVEKLKDLLKVQKS
jgi:soluble lytic murein transglycosylase-like protein